MEAHWPAYGNPPAHIWKPAGPQMAAGMDKRKTEGQQPYFVLSLAPLVRGYALPNRKPIVEVRKGEET